jgi:hypothetical protein
MRARKFERCASTAVAAAAGTDLTISETVVRDVEIASVVA